MSDPLSPPTPSRSSRNSGFERSPEPVIARIAELAGAGRTWSLKAAELRGLLGLGSAEFHRRLYAAQAAGNRLVGLDLVGADFSQENVGELVSLLELFCGAGVEQPLQRAGIFFPHREQVEIMGCFLGEAGRILAGHRLEQEQFSAMLRTFGSFERAREVYREEYFPLGQLREQAARRYCAGCSFLLPELALANVRRLLEFFFQKHVLQAESLFGPLFERLHEQAVREGYARPRPEEERPGRRRAGALAGGQGDAPAMRARRLLGLQDGALDLRRLKSRYKTLMKIYHPDLNPQGLRRCQEINAAYGLLASGQSWPAD